MSELEWMRTFSKNLRQMIDDSRMSQKEIAYNAGISEASLTNYIKGTRMPTAKAILNISYALDCDVSDLMDFGERIR